MPYLVGPTFKWFLICCWWFNSNWTELVFVEHHTYAQWDETKRISIRTFDTITFFVAKRLFIYNFISSTATRTHLVQHRTTVIIVANRTQHARVNASEWHAARNDAKKKCVFFLLLFVLKLSSIVHDTHIVFDGTSFCFWLVGRCAFLLRFLSFQFTFICDVCVEVVVVVFFYFSVSSDVFSQILNWKRKKRKDKKKLKSGTQTRACGHGHVVRALVVHTGDFDANKNKWNAVFRVPNVYYSH